jgi:hypothetical protein
MRTLGDLFTDETRRVPTERLSFEISNGLREVPEGLVELIHAGGEAGLVYIDVFSISMFLPHPSQMN